MGIGSSFKKLVKFTDKFITFGLASKLHEKLNDWLNPDIDAPGVLVEKQGTDQSIPVVYGTRKVPAIKIFKNTSDTRKGAKNEHLHILCVFCEGEVEAIQEVFFNDISEHKKKSKYLTIERHLGKDNQTASPAMLEHFPDIWTAAHKLSGLCYIYVKLTQNKDQNVWQGEPTIKAKIKGKKVTDPRTGTFAYSENPAVCYYDYLTSTKYGKGIKPGRMVIQSFKDTADFCDTVVGYEETVTSVKARYREDVVDGEEEGLWREEPVTTTITTKQMTFNAVINTGKSVLDNCKTFLSGMRAIMPLDNGRIRLKAETEGSSIFSFNQDNIIGGLSSSAGGKKSRFNRVIVRFANTLLSYELDEVIFPAPGSQLATDWLAEDNGELLERSFSFDSITNKAEAMQMAQLVAYRSRQDLKVTLVGNSTALMLEPGDIVDITDTHRGWIKKSFRIQEADQLTPATVKFVLVEHQNSIYPWSVSTVAQDEPDTYFNQPTDIEPPTALAYHEDINSELRQGYLSWEGVDDIMVKDYLVQLFLGNTIIFSASTPNTTFDITTIQKGTYTLKVYSQNALYRTDPATKEITIAAAPLATRYTWIRWADNVDGLNISEDPTGKAWQGVAANKETKVASNNPADYTWFKNKGEDGQPGEKGDQGEEGVNISVQLVSSNGFSFKNNTGATKAITAQVALNGVLSGLHDQYKYKWLSSGQQVYVNTSGDYVDIKPGGSLYAANGEDPGGLNFQTINVDPNDVSHEENLNLTCEISNI